MSCSMMISALIDKFLAIMLWIEVRQNNIICHSLNIHLTLQQCWNMHLIQCISHIMILTLSLFIHLLTTHSRYWSVIDNIDGYHVLKFYIYVFSITIIRTIMGCGSQSDRHRLAYQYIACVLA